MEFQFLKTNTNQYLGKKYEVECSETAMTEAFIKLKHRYAKTEAENKISTKR